jgi:hypothetical protein
VKRSLGVYSVWASVRVRRLAGRLRMLVLVRMWVLLRMRMEVRVASMASMFVAPWVSGQLCGRESKTCQQKDRADDRVLRALDRRAELQANGNDDGPQGD